MATRRNVSVWVRVLCGVAAVMVLALGLAVSLSLLVASIGSGDCLGDECGRAGVASLVGGGVALLSAVVAAVLLVILAFRPATGLLVGGAIATGVMVIALLVQAWGVHALDEGQRRGRQVQDVSMMIDRAMQAALVDVTDASSIDQAGILGPDLGATSCVVATGEPGFAAWSRLTFTSGSRVRVSDRELLHAGVQEHASGVTADSAGVSLEQTWQARGTDEIWTVTAACQPLPGTSSDAGA